MRRALMVILPLVVLLGGAGVAAWLMFSRPQPERQVREAPAPLVRVIETQPQEHHFKVETQGTVRPRTEITLSPEVSGRIVFVSEAFAAGGFFEPGDLLIEIDPRDYELAVARAQAAEAEARVRLAREEAEAEVARKEWESLGQGEPSALLLREPQLAEARAALASADAALEQARRDLERCALRAPFAGRVLEKHADLGQYVARGAGVARLYAVDYAEVRLPVPLDQLRFLDLPLEYRDGARPDGLPRVELRARFGGKEHFWQGSIVRTEGEIDPRSRMLHAMARIENPYGRDTDADAGRPPLSVGLFVEAEIEGRRMSEVHVLPREALRGRDQVYVVERGALRFRPVEVVRAERRDVIIGAGLNPGDMVCVSPLEAAVDGMPVTVPVPAPDTLNHRPVHSLP